MTRNSTVPTGVLLVAIGCALPFVALRAQGPNPPPPRAIPGVTAPDAFPRGCVDCHVNRPDLKLDTRISVRMNAWKAGVAPAFLAKAQAYTPAGMKLKGKHPAVDRSLADIPNACLKCHSGTSKSAPPFDRLLHGLHLAGGEKNHFLTLFQGECTHCHKLDLKTGAWSLASGAETQ